MNIISLLLCLLITTGSTGIDRKLFFDALSGNSCELIDHSITLLEKEKPGSKVNAYLGALYMKKANFVKLPVEKMEIFKKGQMMLENEILNHPDNTEFRFIRLILQEHTPKMLKYNSNTEEDKRIIIQNYTKLDKDLKHLISEYSHASKILKPEDLK